MEVYLQKNAPKKKTKKNARKSRNKEKKTIDYQDRNSKSAVGFHKTKYTGKSTSCSTPQVLETFIKDDLIQDITTDSKIGDFDLPRGAEVLDFQSECSKEGNPKQENILKNENEDELVTHVAIKPSFDDDINSNKSDPQEHPLPFPVKIINSKSDSKKEITKKSSKQKKKNSKVFNAQELYKVKVPKPSNRLEKVCTKCTYISFNEPRNKKLLAVIDLDLVVPYFDPEQSDYEKPTSRPFLNYFLASLYDYYDLAFWTKTTMDVLMVKLNSLGIITKKHCYKICFCLDNTSIMNSYIPRLGNPDVKLLEVIWSLYPQYTEKNTILIDDERNKFIINKKCAVQVKNSMKVGFLRDPELISLTAYLVHIAESGQDLSKFGVRISNECITKQSEYTV